MSFMTESKALPAMGVSGLAAQVGLCPLFLTFDREKIDEDAHSEKTASGRR
jgi:hypothetical protein